jgi:hypothetical protein
MDMDDPHEVTTLAQRFFRLMLHIRFYLQIMLSRLVSADILPTKLAPKLAPYSRKHQGAPS